MRHVFGVLLLVASCGQGAHASPAETDDRTQDRLQMVNRQVEARGIRNPQVLKAMRRVPRHLFVPKAERPYAYADRPLPIGYRQTISQPYIVALMTELADVKPGDRVLEVGTGSGYQAAVLAEMGVRVFSVEIVEPLAKRSRATLDALGYAAKVSVRAGDGYAGWPTQAPFDAIIVTAAPSKIPEPLKQQLKNGGHLVIPVGDHFQRLTVVTKTEGGFRERSVAPVRFVPMTGKAQED